MRSTKVYQSMQLIFICKNNEEPNRMYEICASLKPFGVWINSSGCLSNYNNLIHNAVKELSVFKQI